MASKPDKVVKKASMSSVSVTGNSNFVIATGKNCQVNFGRGSPSRQDSSASSDSDDSVRKKSFRKIFSLISKRCAGSWKTLVRELPWPDGMPDDELENEILSISRDHQNDIKEQCYQGLFMWTQRYHNRCTDDVVFALEQCDLKSVAEEVEKLEL